MKPLVLIIRDGWGYRPSCRKNALCKAKTPRTDELMKKYPHTLLEAAGNAVGLPEGYQGNSEVGHLTIGSGRIINQSLARIQKSISTKEFFKIPEFLRAIQNAKKKGKSLHLIGLLQSEGIHAHIDHLFALLDLCKKENFYDVLIHIITDGRDAPVHASLQKLRKLNKKIKELGFGKIASISGRYFAMDRDKRWERTKKAYTVIVKGKGKSFTDPKKELEECHSSNETDEFILPRRAEGYKGFEKDDSVIFFNFRTDRTRQLTKAIVEKDFDGFKREQQDVFFVAMTQFYKPMNAKVAFGEIKVTNLLGEVISKHNLKQLRISETEKYAHVTFFFNGQREKPYRKEERIMVHSPKVATYDLKPEMSVYEVTAELLKHMNYDVVVVNLVNGDMVGHTGIDSACVKAAEAVDECMGKIVDKTLELDGQALVFADHGNIEDQRDAWRTSHTINTVPLIYVSKEKRKLKKGGLKDIAPTALDLLGITKPKEMTGKSLLK